MLSLLKDKRLYLGIVILIVSGVVTLVALDRVIMPAYTNYNAGVTVPDITKMHIDEAKTQLVSLGLRYEVLDQRSNENYPPDYILDQSPEAHFQVKPNRKVYLTVNASATPTVVVPKLVDMSLRNAEIQLRNFGLEVGNISYTSSRHRNSVLNQSIPAGTTVRRGSAVNLVVSDGLGMNKVKVPDIVGMRLAEAQRELRSAGLSMGAIRFERTDQIEPNHILSIHPSDADSLFEGERLDLTVSELVTTREEEESGVIIIDSTNVEPPSDTPPDTLDNDSGEN